MPIITSIHFDTEEGDKVSVFLGDAMCYVDEENQGEMLQVPVFCNGDGGVIHLTQSEVESLKKNIIIRSANSWVVKSRRKR